jgi:hypothetical protein
VYDGLPLASVGNSNYIWLTDSSNYTMSSWDFYVPFDGAYGVYMVLPRYYGQAKGVLYEVWHSSKNQPNPYKVTLDQTNNDSNRLVYLGSFDYNANWKNSVGVKVAPTNYPAQKVALDTLILVYEGDLGTGGGPSLPPEDLPVQLQTIYSNGDLNFRYEGNYNSPRLLCFGSDLQDHNPIFNNGVKTATVDVLDSSSVYCNIQFEDGTWIGQWFGKMPGQKLLVNDIEITSALDNHQGGTNLVFNLAVDPDDGNTSEPPLDDGDTATRNYNVHVNADVSGLGCSLNKTPGHDGWLNLALMFLPFSLIYMIRATRRLKSS